MSPRSTRQRVMSHMDESCHTYEWVMSHIWMSHVTYTQKNLHTYIYVCSSQISPKSTRQRVLYIRNWALHIRIEPSYICICTLTANEPSIHHTHKTLIHKRVLYIQDSFAGLFCVYVGLIALLRVCWAHLRICRAHLGLGLSRTSVLPIHKRVLHITTLNPNEPYISVTKPTYTHKSNHINAYICIYLCVYIYIHAFASIYICLHTYMHKYIPWLASIYVHIYRCTYMHEYIHTYFR